MKLAYIYYGVAALALGLTSCDNISEDDRFIPVPRPHTDKAVLIEEFTGANCPNCPTGAAKVSELHEQYGDNVIPVSLYPSNAGSLTEPQPPIKIDLRTELASTYYSAFNVENLPAAMFNRTVLDNGAFFSNTIATWGTPVAQILATTSPVEITMQPLYDDASKELKVSYDIHFLDAYRGEVAFQLWIVENGIVATQTSNTGHVPTYVHNHVLRASLNGTWGDSFDKTNFMPEDHLTGAGTVTLGSTWKAENCQVVGFLYNTKTKEIIQPNLLKSIITSESVEE